MRLSSTNVKMFPQERLIENSVRLAYENKLTVYDSLYVSLAEVLKAPLLSLDSKQAEVARKMRLKVVMG
jgi:predicted nucleic acid-binding protein